VEYVDLQKYNFMCSKQKPGQLMNAETLHIILEIHVYQELKYTLIFLSTVTCYHICYALHHRLFPRVSKLCFRILFSS